MKSTAVCSVYRALRFLAHELVKSCCRSEEQTCLVLGALKKEEDP